MQQKRKGKKSKKKEKEKKRQSPTHLVIVLICKQVFSSQHPNAVYQMLAAGLALLGGPCFACPAGAPAASDAKCTIAKQVIKCLVFS